MKRLLILALVLAASPALAQTASELQFHRQPALDYALVVGDPDHPILTLKPGGCLKGPLKVYQNGKLLFQLNSSGTLPDGCMK